MAFTVRPTKDGLLEFTIDAPRKGAWTHASPLSCPPGFCPVLTNWDVPAGVPTTMAGDDIYFATAYGSTYTPTLLCDRRTTTAQQFLLGLQDTTDGRILKWNSAGGGTWDALRTGLVPTGTAAVQWSMVPYGTDLFISNPYDGVYRYDGDTLVPVGAKVIAQCESDEAALWSSETADTAIFTEGLQSFSIATGAHAAASVTMIYTPTTALDLQTGRFSAANYSLTSAGTDYIHFKFRCSDISLLDTAASNVILTTSGGNVLTFPATVWRTARSATILNVATAADATWMDIYLLASTATPTGTYNPASTASVTFTFNSTAADITCWIDDIYAIYATTMPAVRFLAEWKNVLLGLATTAAEDTVYFSPVQAPDQYSTFANFPLKSGGEAITGAKNYFTQLVIGAENATHSISGSVQGYTYPAYIFDQQLVSPEHGVSSHRSMVEANNRLEWWYKGQIVEYRGTGTTKVSYQLDVTLADEDGANLQYIVGAPFRKKNQVWWSWRRSGQSANDRVLRHDYIEGALLPTEGLSTPLLHRCWVSGVEKLLSVNTTDRKVYAQNAATLTFMGTAIAATMELPPLLLPRAAENWYDGYVQYLSNTGTLTVADRTADHLRALAAASYATRESIDQAAAGELGLIRVGEPASLYQMRLSTSGVKAQVQFPLVVYAVMQGDMVAP